jgi:poly-D-alanine transfer protein DltD
MKLNLIKYHILPIVSTLLIVFIIGFFIFDNNPDTIDLVKGNQEETTRIQANYSNGIQGEINFVASLLNKNDICFLGSSEFGNPAIKYYPYNFLKDTLNTRVFAFGHAHQQCFSIYSQLVANQQELKNSNICIILSPSWFITEGTNIEAFIEFVPENYLKRIIHSPLVSIEEKLKIGEYIYNHFDLINEPTLSLTYLANLYKYRNYPLFEKWLNLYKSKISDVKYDIKLLSKTTPIQTSKSLIKKELKTEYINNIKSNSIYVNDEYFLEYLSTKEHPYEPALIEDELFKNRKEFEDFTLLIDLLKKNNCKASFIFQPLNNYHYVGIEKFKPLKKEILNLLKKNNFPILDMFSLSKKEFEPGVLNDIMHTGDYGWTKINQFMYNTYCKTLSK